MSIGSGEMRGINKCVYCKWEVRGINKCVYCKWEVRGINKCAYCKWGADRNKQMCLL